MSAHFAAMTSAPLDDVRAGDYLSRTQLHYVAEHGRSAEVVKRLVDAGADVHAKDYLFRTPLHYVAEHGGSAEVAQALLDAGADVHAKDKFCQTPLHLAKSAGVAKVLIQAGADTDAISLFASKTPMHYAAFKDAAVAKVLLDAGADVNARDRDSRTPLYFARTAEMAEMLLAAGAKIDAKDNKSHSPLWTALKENRVDVCHMLIKAGAVILPESDDGESEESESESEFPEDEEMGPGSERTLDRCFKLWAAAEAELRELRAVPLETREVLRQLAIEVSDWRKERELEVAT